MGKYYVAMLLCAARVRFFFFEMDVWLPPKGPATVLDAFRAAADSWNGGLHTAAAWALQEDNPYTITNDEPAAKPNFFCLGSTLCVT